jgi:broad specificity phosphatase PhoE
VQDGRVSVLLVRHGEPDWHQVDGRSWRGAANDFAPLTAVGRQQARDAASTLTLDGKVDRILSSPMTRALETAHLIASALDVPVQVELNLREWLPDESYSWTSVDEVAAAYADMLDHGGKRPLNHRLRWEPLDVVRERAMIALQPYLDGPRVVAVCHEVLIHAVTGCQRTPHAGQRSLQADRW